MTINKDLNIKFHILCLVFYIDQNLNSEAMVKKIKKINFYLNNFNTQYLLDMKK